MAATNKSTFTRLLKTLGCVDCSAELGKDASHNRCRNCARRWDRAGRPERPQRMPLPAGSYGYSAAYGTASQPEPDPVASMWADIRAAWGGAA